MLVRHCLLCVWRSPACESAAADTADTARVPACKQGIKGKRFNAGLLSYPSSKKPTGLAALNPFATKPQPKPNPVVLDALKPFMKPGKVSEEDVQQRISARFINETVYCLQDGVIKSAQDGDVASIFGIGFPPFTGGPFRYIDSIGTSKYVDQLNRLRDQVPFPASCCLQLSAAWPRMPQSWGYIFETGAFLRIWRSEASREVDASGDAGAFV